MLALIGGLRGVLSGIAAAASLFFLMSLYDRLIDDPSVRKAALTGFVALAEKTALEQKLFETQRQVNAGAQALDEFRKRAAVQLSLAEGESQQLELEIAENEKRKPAGLCRLDDGDIEFLLRRARKAAR